MFNHINDRKPFQSHQAYSAFKYQLTCIKKSVHLMKRVLAKLCFLIAKCHLILLWCYQNIMYLKLRRFHVYTENLAYICYICCTFITLFVTSRIKDWLINDINIPINVEKTVDENPFSNNWTLLAVFCWCIQISQALSLIHTRKKRRL